MPYATWTDQPLYVSPPPPAPRPPRPQPQPVSTPHLAPHNEVQLTGFMLRQVLDHFATLLPNQFPTPIRLVVHGGACFLLDTRLSSIIASDTQTKSKRTTTRDVDYINRSFASGWKLQGVHDATERLKRCIAATATAFRLGMDWMNSDADVALPMATDAQGRLFDPICNASENDPATVIFTSANGWLTLASVTPWWGLAMKFMRYRKQDPQDILTLLRCGSRSGTKAWTPEYLESKLNHWCWPLVYYLDPVAKANLKSKIHHAITLLNVSTSSLPRPSSRPQPSSYPYPNTNTTMNNASMTVPPSYRRSSPSIHNGYVHTSSVYDRTTPIPFVDPAYAKCSDSSCGCQANSKPGLKWASWTSDPYVLEKIRKIRGAFQGGRS